MTQTNHSFVPSAKGTSLRNKADTSFTFPLEDLPRSYPSDSILDGQHFRRLLHDLANGKFARLERFLDVFSCHAGEEHSDAFIHKLQTLCRFLIDLEAFSYVVRMIALYPTLGTYENDAFEGEECVISYAIRMIEDEDIIAQILDGYTGSDLAVFFFEYPMPSTIAIQQRKYRTLKRLFEKKLCTEERCHERYTALQYAACHSQYALAEMLLSELHHNPNLCGSAGVPPIALAAQADDLVMARLLIEHGADVSATDCHGRTAIHYCNSRKMYEWFQANGAADENPPVRTLCRCIDSIKATGSASPHLVETLLGYKPLRLADRDENLLLLAARYGDIATLNRLSPYLDRAKPDALIHAALDWYTLDGITHAKSVATMVALTGILVSAGVRRENPEPILSAFHTLAMRPEWFEGCLEEHTTALFDNIIKLGYPLEEKDCFGKNRFHDAVENLNVPLIRYCLSKGMSYAQLDTAETSAIELLLSHSVNYAFKETNTPLLETYLQNLLDGGCCIDHQDTRGNTPLHKLTKARAFKEYPIRLLVRKGANLHLQNDHKDTPHDIALRRNLPVPLVHLLDPAMPKEQEECP